MGGILLIVTLMAVYILCYWSIAIETLGDKTFGFLGFHNIMSQTFHHKRIVKSDYKSDKIVKTALPLKIGKFKRTYLPQKELSLNKNIKIYKKS